MARNKIEVKITSETFRTASLSTVKSQYLNIAPISPDTTHKEGVYTIKTRSTIKYFCALFEIALDEVSEQFDDAESQAAVSYDRSVLKTFLKA